MAQNDYKKARHDEVAAILPRQMCQKYGFPTAAKSYENFVDKEMSVLENEKVKILWDFSIQTEIKIDHNKPDIVLLDKKEKTCYVIDVAWPFDTRVEKKEKEKFEHYTDLKYELLKQSVRKFFISCGRKLFAKLFPVSSSQQLNRSK